MPLARQDRDDTACRQMLKVKKKYTPAGDFVFQKRKCSAGIDESSFEIGYARGFRKATVGGGPEVFSSEA